MQGSATTAAAAETAQTARSTIAGASRPAWRRAVALCGCAAAGALALGAQSASAVTVFNGNLVVSTLNYAGSAGLITVGQDLLGCAKAAATSAANCQANAFKAIANGAYPNVFENNTVDGSFGVTAPYTLQVLNVQGKSASVTNTIAVPDSAFVGSFSSKSEGALNLSTNGRYITFMGYASTINQLDTSNSNTPGVIDPTNETYANATARAIAQVGANGQFTFTDVNSYSGNNGRAAILDSATGQYLTVGNAGNGAAKTQSAGVIGSTGVQLVTPGAAGTTPGTSASTKVGTFSVTQYGYAADKAGKDDNYRGETIFNNTLYVTKGSGSNGIDTVYQVGTAGSLPTAATAASTPITVLPGFSTALAANNGDAGFYPFGLFFANANTLYVADEGDGTMDDPGTDPNAGLEKWSLVNGVWKLDYTLQNGLGLGVSYGVDGYPTNLDPETDGLRNITGFVNKNGTVTIYGVTSTVSDAGDQGADPNRLVEITDVLGDTSLPANESFTVLETAVYGQVLRGVTLPPVPEPSTWSMMLMGFGGLGALLRSSRRRQGALSA